MTPNYSNLNVGDRSFAQIMAKLFNSEVLIMEQVNLFDTVDKSLGHNRQRFIGREFYDENYKHICSYGANLTMLSPTILITGADRRKIAI